MRVRRGSGGAPAGRTYGRRLLLRRWAAHRNDNVGGARLREETLATSTPSSGASDASRSAPLPYKGRQPVREVRPPGREGEQAG
jgi:hypothetical protein